MKYILAILFAAIPLQGQTHIPEFRNNVRLTLGWTTFLDEDALDHFVAGGSLRHYLTRRISIEPEVLYLRGPRTDRDVTVIGHVAYDFKSSGRARPFVIGGAGWEHHTERFGGRRFTDGQATVSGGFGVRVFLNDPIFVMPEFRVGFEPIARATGSVGFVF